MHGVARYVFRCSCLDVRAACICRAGNGAGGDGVSGHGSGTPESPMVGRNLGVEFGGLHSSQESTKSMDELDENSPFQSGPWVCTCVCARWYVLCSSVDADSQIQIMGTRIPEWF